MLRVCHQAGGRNVVFSSSCAIYGAPEKLPIGENARQAPISPYGWTKLIGERILQDYAQAYGLRYATLRYFNACGADPDGELGEWHDPETHLIPRALLAASGRIDRLKVYGDDYDTPDGTCVRDYVHVSDLARAHVLALRHLIAGGENLAANLGAGYGVSVRQVIEAVERVTGKRVPCRMEAGRPGNPPSLYADPPLARERLGFSTELSDIDTIVRTAARFFGVEARP